MHKNFKLAIFCWTFVVLLAISGLIAKDYDRRAADVCFISGIFFLAPAITSTAITLYYKCVVREQFYHIPL